MEGAETRRESRQEEAVIAMSGVVKARNELARRALFSHGFSYLVMAGLVPAMTFNFLDTN